jgi:hypothetical protein
MPIKAYLPTSGPVFGPETLGNMGKAFESAVTILGIDPRDEAKRTASRGSLFALLKLRTAWMRQPCAIRSSWR